MRQKIVNTLGIFGYASLSLQWMWLFVTLLLPAISQQEVINKILLPQETTGTVSSGQQSFVMPEFIQIIIAVTVTVLVILMIGVMIYRTPRSINRTGTAVSQKSASAIVHHLPRHKSFNEKKEKRLIEKTVWIVKITLVMIPLALLLVPISESLDVSSELVVILGGFFAFTSTLWFGLQYIFSRIWHLKETRIK